MAVFSSLLSSGNVLVAPTRRNRDPISMMMPISSSPSMMKMKIDRQIKAVATASRELAVSSAPFGLYRDQAAATAAMAMAAAVFDYKKMDDEKTKKDSVTADRMDHWVRESIGEIVKNIGEAPFLVQIFSQGPSVLSLERNEASPEKWPLVKQEWDQTSRVPDGIILVEELEDETTNANNNNDDGDATSDIQEGCNKKWGLLVQGRGMDCAASCYILNTCRVRSSAGFCTHFCLVKAKCFGETIDKQLGKAWLQGR